MSSKRRPVARVIGRSRDHAGRLILTILCPHCGHEHEFAKTLEVPCPRTDLRMRLPAHPRIRAA